MQRRKDIKSLTGLRFIAAMCVVVAHALPKIFPWPDGQKPPIFYNLIETISFEGMSLFFVLSGFVIHYNFAEQIRYEGFRGSFNFFVARFARLYPLYLFCLAYDLLYKYSYSQVPASLFSALPYYLSMTQSWFYVPFGDNALIYQFGLMPTVAWSISTEWGFYCMYPLICFGLARLHSVKTNIFAAVVVCVVATSLVLFVGYFSNEINAHAVSHFGDVADFSSHRQDLFIRWLLYFSPYSRVFEFLVGCFCAAIYIDLENKEPTRRKSSLGVTLLIAALVLVVFIHLALFTSLVPGYVHSYVRSYVHWLSFSFGLAPATAIIVFCCARYPNVLTNWLSSKYIELCGDASYSIYLLHLPVIFAFRWEAAPLFLARVYIGDGLRFGMMVFSIIGLSLVVRTLVEIPGRRFLRRLMVAENQMPLLRSSPSRIYVK